MGIRATLRENDDSGRAARAGNIPALRVIGTRELPGQATGRVVHDERGNAMWRMHAPPGDSIESSTVVLRALDTDELALENLARRCLAGYDEYGGYDPYDRVGRDYLPGTPSTRRR